MTKDILTRAEEQGPEKISESHFAATDVQDGTCQTGTNQRGNALLTDRLGKSRLEHTKTVCSDDQPHTQA